MRLEKPHGVDTYVYRESQGAEAASVFQTRDVFFLGLEREKINESSLERDFELVIKKKKSCVVLDMCEKHPSPKLSKLSLTLSLDDFDESRRPVLGGRFSGALRRRIRAC